ncbi:MAG: hypothetical protein ACREU9_12195 [Gammaproteobacteria bacterium]
MPNWTTSRISPRPAGPLGLGVLGSGRYFEEYDLRTLFFKSGYVTDDAADHCNGQGRGA